MTLNAQPLPTGWLKEGLVVRCMAPVSLMLIKHVDDSGVDARRARSSKLDAFHMPPSAFTPATVEDRILFTLDDARISEIRKIIPDGKDERQYKVIFLDHPATATIDQLKPLFEKVQSPERAGHAVIVTVPQSWLDELVITDPVTPPVLARAQAETDLIIEQSAQTPPRQSPPKVEADPAVVDWFTRSFTRLGVDMAAVKIAPAHRLGRAMGQDSTYALFWPSTAAFSTNIKAVSAAAKELHLRDFFANDVKIIVDLPAAWTPTYGESPAPIEAAADAPEPGNADLAETARLIADLREHNARLQAEVQTLGTLADDRLILIDSLTAEIDARDLRALDAEEAVDEPVALRSLSVCKEVKTLVQNLARMRPESTDSNDQELAALLNAGWDILNFTVNTTTIGEGYDVEMHSRIVTLVRIQPAPTAPAVNAANARLIQKVGPMISYHPPLDPAVPAPAMTVNQAETPAINFGTDIASARADLMRMLDDDEINHATFTLHVRRSRLPRQEQDALIAQSFKLRAGKSAGETFRDMQELKPFVNLPFSVPAGGK